MGKRKEAPIVGVVRFFEEAPLNEAELGLALAKAAVAKRQGPKAAKKPTGPKKSESRSVDVPMPEPVHNKASQ